jgi:replication initiation and membrane attachment protein DnaB
VTQPNDNQTEITYGRIRDGFTTVHHEIFDVYHPIIGDKATLYYLYLLRKRNNSKDSPDKGRAWDGRRGVTDKFNFGSATLIALDAILVAAGLVEIELRPSGRGKPKIYYIVHEPLEKAEFSEKEAEITGRLMAAIAENGEVARYLGKEFKRRYSV